MTAYTQEDRAGSRTGPLRFVLIGTGVQGSAVPALLGAALRAGVDVRAAAQRPPEEGASGWHRLAVGRVARGSGVSLASWVTRAVGTSSARLADQLATDPWLAQQLFGPGAGEVLVVGLDRTAERALGRSRRLRRVTSRRTRLLTWDEGAEALAAEVAHARLQGVRTTPRRPSVPPRPERPLGARHAVAVVTPEGRPARPGVRESLSRGRLLVTVVDADRQLPSAVLGASDVLVLDGLSSVVVGLDQTPSRTRGVHLTRAGDERSPWRHLVPEGRVDRTVPASGVEALANSHGSGPPAVDLLAAVLGERTATLVRLAAEEGDEAALAQAREILLGSDQRPLCPHLLQELCFLSKVTGSLTLEQNVLSRLRGTLEDPLDLARVDAVRSRVGAALEETAPGWLPSLPEAVVADPVPGRVLHLLKVALPQRQSGYSVRAHHTLRALVDAGRDVVAVTVPVTSPNGDGRGQALDRASGLGTPEQVVVDGVRYLLPPPLPGGTSSGPVHLSAQARALLQVAGQERPALLHVHSGGRGYDLGVVGAAVSGATGLPWIYEMRGFFESLWTQQLTRAERGETFERRMAKEAELTRSAAATVVLAETMRSDLLARGVDPDRLHVVPNAVDPEVLRPVVRDEALAAKWGTRASFTFGYVSNLDHAREQVEDLIRAAVILRNGGLSVRALVVGDGRRRAELEERARVLGAQDCVIFTGRVPHEEVAAFYGLLDVLVVPRNDERAARLVTPLKPYEAMAMGVPVVVSAQPALLEVIGAGERGWSYPAGDASALAALLTRLKDDPLGRTDVAAKARRWVSRERTWTRNASRYAQIYDSVAGTSTQSDCGR